MIGYWHYVTRKEFNDGPVYEDDIYFIKDTGELYRGKVPFNEAIIWYNEVVPEEPVINKLYIDSTNLEGKVFNGRQWNTVFYPVAQTIDPENTNPASSKAVATYIVGQLAAYATKEDAVSVLSWDAAQAMLSVKNAKEQTTQNIKFSGLGIDLIYTKETGKLQLVDALGNKIGSEIQLADKDKYIRSGEYNDTNKEIVLYYDEEKTDFISFSVAGLVNVYTGDATRSIQMTIDNENKIKGEVKISAGANNLLEVREDGLYVTANISGFMRIVDGAVVGNLATFGEGGQIVDSGVKPDDLKTELATSEDFDAENPSDEKATTEKLLAEMFTWKTSV